MASCKFTEREPKRPAVCAESLPGIEWQAPGTAELRPRSLDEVKLGTTVYYGQPITAYAQ